jgi:hypothetical protein
MRIKEKDLRRLIRSVLIEVRIKPSFDHRNAFNQWLHTVFQGVEDNFRPFVKAVYKSRVKQRKLEDRWNILKNSIYRSNVSEMFYDFLKEKVESNGNVFSKEMIGDFFMENDINPYDLFYSLRFFIKPVKDFSKFSKTKIPSSIASSADFKFMIDESQWDKFSFNAEKNRTSQSFDFNNLSDLSLGDMTSFGKVVKVD